MKSLKIIFYSGVKEQKKKKNQEFLRRFKGGLTVVGESARAFKI